MQEYNLVLIALILNFISIVSFISFAVLYGKFKKMKNINFHLVIMFTSGVTICSIITMPALILKLLDENYNIPK